MPSTAEPVPLASTLLGGDSNDVEIAVERAVKNGSSLRDFFRELFTFSAEHHRCRWSSDGAAYHPLMDLNALKNLAALRLNSPSRSIAEEATRICMEIGRAEQETEPPTPTPEMLNQPLFTQQFVRAVGEADREKAALEAAKISAVSDNPAAVIEIVMEIATHHMDRIGSFVYGVYRSAVFSGRDTMEKFMKLLLSALTNEPWPMEPVEESATSSLSPYLDDVLRSADDAVLCRFAAANRLWSAESVRETGFRKGLSVWAAERFEASGEQESNGSTIDASANADFLVALDEGDLSMLSSAVSQAVSQDDWSWPASVAERWIDSDRQDGSRFLLLDSLQSLSRTAPRGLLPIILEPLIEADRLK